MRIPDAGPFGDTLREASVLAIVAASFVKRPRAGWVASVLTDAIHRFVVAFVFVLGMDWCGLRCPHPRAPRLHDVAPGRFALCRRRPSLRTNSLAAAARAAPRRQLPGGLSSVEQSCPLSTLRFRACEPPP